MLPTDSDFVLGVDLARVQRSVLWQQLVAPALANAPGLRDFETECGFDPLAALASVTIGLKGVRQHKDMSGAIVFHGFAKAKAFACIAKRHAEQQPDAQVRIDGDVMLLSRDNEAHAALTFIDDSTALVVFGPDATKDGIARIAERRGGPAASGYFDMIHEINTDDAVWLAVADGSPMLAEANRKLAAHTAIQLHGLYGSIDFSDGLVINAGARTGSPELVAKFVSDIQHHLDEVARDEIAQRFEQLDINADGGDVILSLAMNTSQLLALVGGASGHIAEHHAQHQHADPASP